VVLKVGRMSPLEGQGGGKNKEGSRGENNIKWAKMLNHYH